MILPKTDPSLLERLVHAARHHRMTAEERFAQRVSFVYGQLGGALSRERVGEILRGQ